MPTKYATILFTVLASASAAQGIEIVAVDGGSDPDALVSFDSTDPTSVSDPFATLDANFIRGFDVTPDHVGYYVSTQTTGEFAAGMYRLTEDGPQKFGDIPFETSAIGDLTLTQDNQKLYAALNPPGQSQTLFEISLDGTFDEIGAIIVAGSGSSDISGLAMHPTTGLLYGLDNRSNSLVEIDPATAEATRIGDGLGIPASFGGAMDFSPDGSELFFVTFANRLHTVDVATGLASEQLGTLPIATTAMAVIPEPASLALLALAGLAAFRRR